MFKPVHSFKVLVVLEYTVDAAAVSLQIERVVVVTAVLEEEYILSWVSVSLGKAFLSMSWAKPATFEKVDGNT